MKSISLNSGVRIHHREAFVEITTGATLNIFEGSLYSCNPGVSAIFPWLAPIAMRYDRYRSTKLVFSWIPRVGTSTAGTVYIAFDHDALDPAPDDALQIMSYAECATVPVWKEESMAVKCDPVFRYTRSGVPGSTNYDLKTYDFGNLAIYWRGVAAATFIGFVGVEYEVELIDPQIQDMPAGKFAATSPDTTHVLKDLVAQSVHGQLPFTVEPTGAIATFLEPFQGLITERSTGVNITNFALNPTSDVTYTQTENSTAADGSSTLRQWAIKALKGSKIIPAVTATSITDAIWTIARGDYLQYV